MEGQAVLSLLNELLTWVSDLYQTDFIHTIKISFLGNVNHYDSVFHCFSLYSSP